MLRRHSTELLEIKYVPIPVVEHFIQIPVIPKHQAKLKLSTILQKKKNDLQHAISILQRVIRKRKIPIYLAMSGVIIGVGAYMYYLFVKTQEFKVERDNEFLDQLSQLNSQAYELNVTRGYLIANESRLVAERNELVHAWISVKQIMHKVQAQWSCLAGEQSFDFSIGCDEELVAGSTCPVIFPYYGLCDEIYGNYKLINDSMCHSYFPMYCAADREYLNKYQEWLTIYELIKPITDLISQLSDKIKNLAPNYGNVLSNSFRDLLLLAIFGECTPVAFILITLLTNVITDCICCIKMNGQQTAEVELIAEENLVEFDTHSYRKILNNLDQANKGIDKEIKKDKPAADRRDCIMRNSLILCDNPTHENKIYDIIFDYDGEATDNLNSHTRHIFELAGKESNQQPTVNANDEIHFNPLFSFFSALKEDNPTQSKRLLSNIYEYV